MPPCRVFALAQHGACLGSLVAGSFHGDIGPGTEREPILLAPKAVLEPPQLATCRSDLDVQPFAVSSLAGLFPLVSGP